MKPTLENFEKLLSKIKWRIFKLNHTNSNYYVINDHKDNGVCQLYFSFDEKIGSLEFKDIINNTIIYYDLSKCFLQMIDRDCVSLTVKNTKKAVFILFMNHDLKGAK